MPCVEIVFKEEYAELLAVLAEHSDRVAVVVCPV